MVQPRPCAIVDPTPVVRASRPDEPHSPDAAATLVQTISAPWRLCVRSSFDGAFDSERTSTHMDSVGCVERSIRAPIVLMGLKEEGSHAEARRRREERRKGGRRERRYGRGGSCEIFGASRSSDWISFRPGETPGPPYLHGPLPGSPALARGEGESDAVLKIRGRGYRTFRLFFHPLNRPVDRLKGFEAGPEVNRRRKIAGFIGRIM